MELEIGEWSKAQAVEFMDREWPRHPAPPGVVWAPFELVLAARRDVAVGVAVGVVVGGVGELKQLLVRRGDDRVGGVGSALLREFRRRCQERGCHKLRLETADYQARPFYERHGFTVAATLSNDRFGRTWFIMESVCASASDCATPSGSRQ
jgi:ribosomal protein S18 acetylase RimI-like enzyme